MNYEKCSAKSLKKKTIRYELIGCPFCGREDTVALSDCRECFVCIDEPYNCAECKHLTYTVVCDVNAGGCGASSCSCHRAVHIYYKRFLQDKGRSDFTSNEEALLAYMSAKAKVVKE